VQHRIVTIVGARPQFIKAAAISRALRTSPEITEEMIHTGQHFDDNMSEVFFRELAIPVPRHNLGIHGGPHGAMTGQMLAGIEGILIADPPSMVLIYGDTNSTLAGALAASKLHIPVAHVEAGLRSFNRRMPEEINRVLSDHLSSLLFCPTRTAIHNLATEGITEGVTHTGDVMFDATLFARETALQTSDIVERLDLESVPYSLCTIHRSENTDNEERLREILHFVDAHAEGNPVIFPIHPRTRQAIVRYGINTTSIKITEPLGYFDLHRLLANARLVMTDSGGLQKEAYFHRVPCITLRDETEWVETITAGWNRLWKESAYKETRIAITDYGKGDAAQKILVQLLSFLATREA